MSGETFGNSSLKYFQNIRSAMMASSKSSYNSVPLSSHTQDSTLPYWVRYNINSKAEGDQGLQHGKNENEGVTEDHVLSCSLWSHWLVMIILDFSFPQLSQKHRENYKDKTGTVQPVNYFVMPEKEKKELRRSLRVNVRNELYYSHLSYFN